MQKPALGLIAVLTLSGAADAQTIPATNHLALWLKADAGITLNGANVSAWADQSGRSNNALQATADAQPLLAANAFSGKPAVRFDGKNDALKTGTNALNPASFTVAFVADYGSGDRLMELGTLQWGQKDQAVWDNFVGSKAGPGQNNTNLHVHVLSWDGTNYVSYQHGAYSPPQIRGKPTTRTDVTLGGRHDLQSFAAGDLAEVMIFDRCLATNELSQVETYLGAKYGITVNPIRHKQYALAAARKNDPHLIFYAPFEGFTEAAVAAGEAKPLRDSTTFEEGKVGLCVRTTKTYQPLCYDGRGNVDLNCGTLACFFKPNYDVVEEEWAEVISVATEIEGYWNSVLDFILIDANLNGQLFDVGRYTRRLGWPIVGRWKKGEWVHLAMTWDRKQGIRVYENGVEKASSWGAQNWHWNQVPSVLNINGGYYSSRDTCFDEFTVYSRVLPPEAIAALARGEIPKSQPVALVAADVHEKREREKYGWAEEDLKALPVVGSRPIEFKWARVDHTEDCKRRMAQPFEGLPSSCWPHARYGASVSGKQLEIHIDQGVPYDRVRLFAQRPFQGRIAQPQPVGDPKPLVEVNAARPVWRAVLPQPLQSPLMLLQRDDGWIGQIEFFGCSDRKPSPKVAKTYLGAELLARVPDTEAGLAIKSWLSRSEQRCVTMTAGEAAKSFTVKSPAFEGFQMLTEPITNSTPLEGVVVTLVTRSIAADTPVTIKVREPIWPQREWCNADVLVKAGTKAVTLVLRPRPLLTKAGEPLAVEVVAGAPVEWMLGKKGCSVGLIEGNRNKIYPIHVADQMEFIREAFSEISEGHIFDYLGDQYNIWARLARPALAFNEIAPAHPDFMQLKHRLGWEKERTPYPTPANPTNAPEWALWQQECLRLVKTLIHWIIDNRQIANGEFGGVWGDDTDMVENWMGIWLASDDDDKIKNSVRLLMDGVWKYNLKEGASASIRDELHSYEEGSGTISQRLIVDYGNPTAIERVMTACTHYDKWAKKAADGKWDFISSYFGATGAWTHGAFASSEGGYLMLVQACWLSWYNRHPAVRDILVNWRPAGKHAGMATDAAYELTKSPELYKFYEKLVNEPNARYAGPIAEALCVAQAQASTSSLWSAAAGFRGLESASTNFPTTIYGIGSMHVSTEAHYLAWKATGDKKYLVDGFKMVCQHLNEQMWLYTGALPSTDRCPPPGRALIRTLLGSRPADRGGDSNFWPRHALSYERGADNLAALVLENTEKTIKTLFWAFDARNHALKMRVWRLPPGEYKLGLYDDPEGDGKPNGTIKEWTARLERYAPVDVVLPPAKQVLFTVDPIQVQEMNYDKPDLAIGPEDVNLEFASGHLHVTVHNVGIKPADKIVVHAIDLKSGKVVDTAIVDHLDAPLDLKPRTGKIEFHNVDSQIYKVVEVVVDPENKIDELTKFNNRLVYRF